MRLAPRGGAAAVVVAVALTATTLQAGAEDRSQLVACQALIERAAQSAQDSGSRQDAPELVRCRQIVREWLLRDARMSVDERGQPLR
jgi:hypothetical protein